MARNSKEGLLERSRRFLGANRRTTSQPEIPYDSENKPDLSPDLTAYQRRRDQVRRAQRSHRERKENYIKSLEQEILQLRESHSMTLHNVETQVAYLKNVIDIHGIPLSDQWKDEAAKFASFNHSPKLAMASFAQQGNPSGFIQISRQDRNYQSNPGDASNIALFGNGMAQPPLGDAQYGYQASSSAFTDTQSQHDSSVPHSGDENMLSSQIQNTSTGSKATKVGSETNTTQQFPEDMTSLGIDFVLTLEHTCMSHIAEFRSYPSEMPSNHAFMASQQLLAHAPEDVNLDTTWPVPETTIKNLLTMSSQFDLVDEITPVQAWQKLRSHPAFGRFDRKSLEALKLVLAQEVKCFGFGAVMDSAVFDIALEELFLKTSGS